MPIIKEKCYFRYMKKILLVLSILLMCGCSTTNYVVTSGKSSDNKGKLVKTIENPLYYYNYETHTYTIYEEYDPYTYEKEKPHELGLEKVYYVVQDHSGQNSTFLIYTNDYQFIIYFKWK